MTQIKKTHFIATYECSECKYAFEKRQKIDSKPLIKCPECKKKTLESIIELPIMMRMGDARTFGTLAERNTKKLGYEKIAVEETKKAKDRIKAKQKAGPQLPGLKPLEITKTKDPWYGKCSPKIAKETDPAKIHHYIMTGEEK